MSQMHSDPPADSLRFSVVIPTFARRELVTKTVSALMRQAEAPRFEVIVVVDGSRDGSARALRSLELPFKLTVLEQANQGAAAARNRGAAAARGELLLFLDDDMEPDPGLLSEHDRSHGKGAGVVVGHVPLHPDSPRSFLTTAVERWAEERAARLLGSEGPPNVGDIVTGHMSVGRELFERLGGFDTTFTRHGTFGNEDLDFARRLTSAGVRIVFNPKAVSRQRYVVTPGAYLGQWRDLGAADVLLARKHPELAPERLRRGHSCAEGLRLRLLRPALRTVTLACLAVRPESRRAIRWFFRVRRLEYERGLRAQGGAPARQSVRVLCYHSISDLSRHRPLRPYGIPARQFRAQIRFLDRHFRFITADELLRLLDGTGGVPKRAVLLTFDDCYQDLLAAGAEVLGPGAIPAVAFAVTQRLGGTNEWDARIGADVLPLLDAAGLTALSQHNVAIGSHSRTHRMLDQLTQEEIRSELSGALADLEVLPVPRTPVLSYPHGRHDERVRRIAEEVGYRAAFTVTAGLVVPSSSDAYALPRIEILRGDRGVRFWWKVCRPPR